MREEKRWPYKMRRLMLMLFLVLALSGNDHVVRAQGIGVSTGGEERAAGKFCQTEKGWIYLYEDGTQAKGGLLSIDGKTYYFSEDGIRQYGWQKIDGKWYYFGSKSKGYMYKNTWVKENGKRTYYLLSDGSRCQGWYSGKNTYYFDKNGRLVTGF